MPLKKDSKLKNGVNWCEVTIYKDDEKVYYNAFITDIKITDKNVEDISNSNLSYL